MTDFDDDELDFSDDDVELTDDDEPLELESFDEDEITF
jgi:hypothetical protein